MCYRALVQEARLLLGILHAGVGMIGRKPKTKWRNSRARRIKRGNELNQRSGGEWWFWVLTLARFGSDGSNGSGVSIGPMGQMGLMGQMSPIGPMGLMSPMSPMDLMGQMSLRGQVLAQPPTQPLRSTTESE